MAQLCVINFCRTTKCYSAKKVFKHVFKKNSSLWQHQVIPGTQNIYTPGDVKRTLHPDICCTVSQHSAVRWRIWLCSVLCPRQHSIGYTGDGFYRSKDPTNSIKVLKEILQRKDQTTQTTKYTYAYTIIDKKRIQIYITTSPLVYGVTRGRLSQGQVCSGLNGSGAATAVPAVHWWCLSDCWHWDTLIFSSAMLVWHNVKWSSHAKTSARH